MSAGKADCPNCADRIAELEALVSFKTPATITESALAHLRRVATGDVAWVDLVTHNKLKLENAALKRKLAAR